MAKMNNALELKKLYESDDFISNSTYDGNDLGATYSPAATTFKVWAPVAVSLKVCIYEKGTPDEAGDKLLGTFDMAKDERNVYELKLAELGDLHGKFYTYLIKTGDNEVETADPYCVSCGANSIRSMVVDLNKTNPDGWSEDKKPEIDIEEAVVYETHVKDFSYDENSGIDESLRGKYLAFTVTDSCYIAENRECFVA